MRLHLSNSITDELGVVFVARELSEGTASLEETEDITVKVVSLDEAVQMAMDGRITDALGVTGLLRYRIER
jgi:hypothetical protein